RTNAVISGVAPGIALQPAKRGVASGHDESRIARRGERIVEGTEIGGGLQTENFTAFGDVAHIIVRRKIADRAGAAGRLADVPVVEDELISPGRRVVEIVLPSPADDRSPVVAAKA